MATMKEYDDEQKKNEKELDLRLFGDDDDDDDEDEDEEEEDDKEEGEDTEEEDNDVQDGVGARERRRPVRESREKSKLLKDEEEKLSGPPGDTEKDSEKIAVSSDSYFRKRKRDEGEETLMPTKDNYDSENDEEGTPDEDDLKFIDNQAEQEDKEDRNMPWAGGDEDEEDEEDQDLLLQKDAEAIEVRENEEQDEDENVGRSKATENTRNARYIVNRMADALDRDVQCNMNRQPAIHRLSIADEVLAACKNKYINEILLDFSILKLLRKWLDPLPQTKAPPSIDLKRYVIDCCDSLPIHTSDKRCKQLLKESELGRAIMAIYKGKNEVKENRREARAVISKWSRPIFSLNSSNRKEYFGEAKPVELRNDSNNLGAQKHIAVSRLSNIIKGDEVLKPENYEVEIDDFVLKGKGGKGGMNPSIGGSSISGKGKQMPSGNLLKKNLLPVNKTKGDEWRPRAMIPQPAKLDYSVRPVVDLEVSLDITRDEIRKRNTLEVGGKSERLRKLNKKMFNKKRGGESIQRDLMPSVEGKNLNTSLD